ncbi:MAG: hypothetical protein VB140_08935 [Burkholderia sp.]
MRTSLVRNPFVSPELCPSMPWSPHVRFMQQRHLRRLQKSPQHFTRYFMYKPIRYVA